MSERYTRVFSLSKNLYAEGSPIILKAGALLKDNETGRLLAQLKLSNIADKNVKFVKVEISCLDSVGRELDSPFNFDYLDLSVARGVDFGTQTPIRVSNYAARSYKARVLEVGFADNSVWSDNGNAWEPLKDQDKVESIANNRYEISGYKSAFGKNADYIAAEDKDIWRCACGAINHKGEEECYNCSSKLESLLSAEHEDLEKEGIYSSGVELYGKNDIPSVEKAISEFSKIKLYKDSDNWIIKCNVKIAKIKKDQENEQAKKKKVIKLAAFIGGGLVVLGLLVSFAIYPLIALACGDYSACIKLYRIKDFDVPKNVTTIKNKAFYDCETLKSVTIPSSVTSIEDSAFTWCSDLESIVIPEGVTSIGEYAFRGCDNLKTVVIPSTVRSIGEYAFSSCSSLTSITIPSGVTEIEKGVFEFCTNLTSVTISNGVTSIGEDAFRGCYNLKTVVIPSTVRSIGEYAFSYCSSLTSITIPSSVKRIGEYAFTDCFSLTSITLQHGVAEVGYGAFDGCENLKNATIPKSVTSMSYSVFYDCSKLTAVYYKGSRAQWREMTDTKYHWADYTVYCTDGNID